jgi:hypothetical protein
MAEGPVNSVLVFIMLDVGNERKGRGKGLIIIYHFKFIWKLY